MKLVDWITGKITTHLIAHNGMFVVRSIRDNKKGALYTHIQDAFGNKYELTTRFLGRNVVTPRIEDKYPNL